MGRSPHPLADAASDLPFVDRHAVDVEVSPEVAWETLARAATSMTQARRPRLFNLLWDPEPASGFEVGHRNEGERLELVGRHRFSRYRLTFTVEADANSSRLAAITHATFPGILGALYRTVVIRSGLHALVTRGLLRRLAKRARSRTAGRDGP